MHRDGYALNEYREKRFAFVLCTLYFALQMIRKRLRKHQDTLYLVFNRL